MNIMSEIGRLLSPNDPELVEKTLARIAEQDTWNDVFSTKLIELLDSIDSLKAEHREKLRALQSAQDTWNDVFSTKQTEFLDNIDSLKAEHREKLRAIQSALASASASLEHAERAHYKASESILEVKQILDVAATKLDLAVSLSQGAKQDLQAAEGRLRSADQCMQKARELAQKSQEEYVQASKQFRAVMQYALWAFTISMASIVWVIWVALRPDVPLWAASFASLIVVMAGTFAPRLVKI